MSPRRIQQQRGRHAHPVDGAAAHAATWNPLPHMHRSTYNFEATRQTVLTLLMALRRTPKRASASFMRGSLRFMFKPRRSPISLVDTPAGPAIIDRQESRESAVSICASCSAPAGRRYRWWTRQRGLTVGSNQAERALTFRNDHQQPTPLFGSKLLWKPCVTCLPPPACVAAAGRWSAPPAAEGHTSGMQVEWVASCEQQASALPIPLLTNRLARPDHSRVGQIRQN